MGILAIYVLVGVGAPSSAKMQKSRLQIYCCLIYSLVLYIMYKIEEPLTQLGLLGGGLHAEATHPAVVHFTWPCCCGCFGGGGGAQLREDAKVEVADILLSNI